MSFVRPELLWLALLALPELLLARARIPRLRISLEMLVGPGRRERAGAAFAAFSFYGTLAGALFIVAAALALAGPSWGRRGAAAPHSGLETAIVLDVSRSMEARDGSPTRLDAAKSIIRGLVETAGRGSSDAVSAGGGAFFALVAFKGDAVMLVPMTEDATALDAALDYASPDTLTARGTDLEKGLAAGLAAFTATGAGNRLLVVISDGGELSGSAQREVEDMRKHHARLIVVGVGGSEPTAVPGPGGGSLLDSKGLPVRSALDSRRLRALAVSAEGRYLDAADPGLEAAFSAELRVGRVGGTRVEYESVDRSGLVAGFALIFLICVVLADMLAARGARA